MWFNLHSNLFPSPPHVNVFLKANYQLGRAVRNRSNCSCSTSSLHQDTLYCCRRVTSRDGTGDQVQVRGGCCGCFQCRCACPIPELPFPAESKPAQKPRSWSLAEPANSPQAAHTHTHVCAYTIVLIIPNNGRVRAADFKPLLRADLQ